MLILTRKLGESITIGDDIKITFLDIRGKQIRVGIEAPKTVSVHRQEVYQLIRDQNIAAANHETGMPGLSELWEALNRGPGEKELTK